MGVAEGEKGKRFGRHCKRYRIFCRPNRIFCRPISENSTRVLPSAVRPAFQMKRWGASRFRKKNSRYGQRVQFRRDRNSAFAYGYKKMPNTVTSIQEPKKRVLFRYFFNAFHEKVGMGGGIFMKWFLYFCQRIMHRTYKMIYLESKDEE